MASLRLIFTVLSNLDIGASITAYAREYVKDILKELEDEGLEVIYGVLIQYSLDHLTRI